MIAELKEKIAIVHNERKLTYGQLKENIAAMATLFSLHPGERAAIFAGNNPEWVMAFYAIWQHHGVPVPIDFMSGADEVRYICADSEPRVIFHSNETLPVLSQAVAELEYEPQLINLDNLRFTEAPPSGELFLMSENPDDTAVIIYTSGTTGSPKGVMLTYTNIMTNIKGVTEGAPIYDENQRVLSFLPLHHVFPLLGTMIVPLHVGGTMVIVSSLVAEDLINALQQNKITLIIGVPRFYSLIHKGIKEKINASIVVMTLFKLAALINSQSFSRKLFKKVHERFGGHVRFMVSGGAALPKEVGRDLWTLGFEVLEGYGMTEAAPMITFPRPGHVKLGTTGQPLQGTEIRFDQGEILAKGPNIMKGYFNRPDETAQVLKDGWLHTGDLGEMDDDGYLTITGRKKEIIVLPNGKNINPEEIEHHVAEMTELINEIGVFQKNNVLQAVIYPDLDRAAAAGVVNLKESLKEHVVEVYNKNVAPYKRISSFELVNEPLPRTRLGKLRRFQLPELVAARDVSVKSTEEPASEQYRMIKSFLEEESGMAVHPWSHVEIDLGLDSLSKVSLVAWLNKNFGLELREDDLVQFKNVAEIAAMAEKSGTIAGEDALNWSEILKQKVDLTLPKTWFTNHIIKTASKWFFKLYFRFRAEGTENLPEGPFILAANHQSFFDGLFVVAHLKYKTLKRTYFYAKAKHVRRRWVRFIANRNNVIVMDINKDLKASLQKMAEVLRNGKNLVIFPEGTRSKDGALGRFKKTFAILSRELKVPVVPVTIKGAFDALPVGKKFPRPWKKITVKYGKPVMPHADSIDAIVDDVVQQVSSDLEKQS